MAILSDCFFVTFFPTYSITFVPSLQKIKFVKFEPKGDIINLALEKNVDILNYVSKHNSLRPKVVIGFAAETNDLKENSKRKLNDKSCDWIIANNISDKSIGFESDFNEVTIFYKNKKIEKISKMKKSILSDIIVQRIVSELN